MKSFAAKVVLNEGKYSSLTWALRSLNWLPVETRIEFKVSCWMFKCDSGWAPGYLCNKLCKVPTQKYNVRSSLDTHQYVMPKTKQLTFAARAFSVRGPKIWNSLPLDIRDGDNLCQCKKKLTIFSFKKSFN